jgi:hypothetical protein
VDVSIKKKPFKKTNLKITKKFEIVTYVEFKVRAKDLLDL